MTLAPGLLAAALQVLVPDSAILRGTIVAAGTDAALPLTIVELSPPPAQRFTNHDGSFSFLLRPGTYRLRARQIGYRPRDTTITVGTEGASVRLAMLRIAVRLSPIVVTGETECVSPGRPDAGSAPGLAMVFDQLLENARRHVLLADSYPHRYHTQRTFKSTGAVDTVTHESWVRWAYVPGQVVGPPNRNNERLVRLMTLPDFADSAFVTHHCFWLAGRDTLEGQQFIRVDFAPGPGVATADVAGAAYLDPDTYQLTFIDIQLTRPDKISRGVRSVHAVSRFREVLPGIPLVDRVRAVQEFGPRGNRVADNQRVEEQQLLNVSFLRPVVNGQ